MFMTPPAIRTLLRSQPIGLRSLARNPMGVRFNSTSATLNWEKFLALRKKERHYNVVALVFTTLVGLGIGGGIAAQFETDASMQVFGFDPVVVFIATTVVSGGLGYLIGPSFGLLVFKQRNKALYDVYQKKNSLFLKRIIKNRADPAKQSFANPVPDFYGEKITSLKEYKQWLRDCNAYRRKTLDFL